ncbi:hypothetical protein Tco_0946522 [Tanacetum coccineum]
MALAAASKEAEWLKNLLLEIPLWVKPIAPIFIRCDSAATLEKAYSQMYNGKSRHLGVRHSMIRELITNGVVSIEFVRSQQNLADHLTNGVARDLVIKSAEGKGLNQAIDCLNPDLGHTTTNKTGRNRGARNKSWTSQDASPLSPRAHVFIEQKVRARSMPRSSRGRCFVDSS